jgi:hypothetical protein
MKNAALAGFMFAGTTLSSSAFGADAVVPLSSAPKAEASGGYPICQSYEVRGLPTRVAFEEKERDFQRAAIVSAVHFRNQPRVNELRPYLGSYQRFNPVDPLRLSYGVYWSSDHSYWKSIHYWMSYKPNVAQFVATYRTETGFRDGETPIVVGNRAYRRYPNGAISLGYLEGRGADVWGGCFGGGGHTPGYTNDLPAPGERLGDPPDISGEGALAIVHDMNPYLTFVALAEPGKQLAARLVVLSTYTDAPRLAWEARYSFACWNTGHGDVVPKLSSDSAYVYVDARNGSLVFGRDTARKGGVP